LNEVKETKEKAAKLEAENEKQKSLLVHYQSRLSNVEAENARLKMILKSLRDSNKSNDIGLYGSVEPVASFSNVDCYNDTANIGFSIYYFIIQSQLLEQSNLLKGKFLYNQARNHERGSFCNIRNFKLLRPETCLDFVFTNFQRGFSHNFSTNGALESSLKCDFSLSSMYLCESIDDAGQGRLPTSDNFIFLSRAIIAATLSSHP